MARLPSLPKKASVPTAQWADGIAALGALLSLCQRRSRGQSLLGQTLRPTESSARDYRKARGFKAWQPAPPPRKPAAALAIGPPPRATRNAETCRPPPMSACCRRKRLSAQLPRLRALPTTHQAIGVFRGGPPSRVSAFGSSTTSGKTARPWCAVCGTTYQGAGPQCLLSILSRVHVQGPNQCGNRLLSRTTHPGRDSACFTRNETLSPDG
jgi:hypothetical protein